MSEQNVTTLANELDLTTQERTEVEAIQTTEDLSAYFSKLPRDYDVQIIVSDGVPECRSRLQFANVSVLYYVGRPFTMLTVAMFLL